MIYTIYMYMYMYKYNNNNYYKATHNTTPAFFPKKNYLPQVGFEPMYMYIHVHIQYT